MFEKLVVIHRRSRLEELLERHVTLPQLRFVLSRAGDDPALYEAEHEALESAYEQVLHQLEFGLPVQRLERARVPGFVFAPTDLVVVVGQDGLVANVARYVGAQPVVAINPDPSRIDGLLLPFQLAQTRAVVGRTLEGKARRSAITLAEAQLGDGQRLLAFNDLFIGARSHVSARYRLHHGERSEEHSSSGVLVSTGVGSSGWLSSAFRMAAGLSRLLDGEGEPFDPRTGRALVRRQPMRIPWETERLFFAVREPFVSRTSQAELVGGWVDGERGLVLESRMPSGGVVFGDGVEADALRFEAGMKVTVRPAAQRFQFVVG